MEIDITKNWTDADTLTFITELDSFQIGDTFSGFTFFKNLTAHEQELMASKINAPLCIEVLLREQFIANITATVFNVDHDELEVLSLNELMTIAQKTEKMNKLLIEILTIVRAHNEVIQCDGTEQI
jgi:hypothetical protein